MQPHHSAGDLSPGIQIQSPLFPPHHTDLIWYLTIKSYFVHVDSAEDLHNRIEKLKAEQERLKELDKECPYRSWLLWTATRAFNYTLQPIVYSIWGWLYGVHDETEVAAE